MQSLNESSFNGNEYKAIARGVDKHSQFPFIVYIENEYFQPIGRRLAHINKYCPFILYTSS